ncbi:hypothetical protein [Metabacillus malikii]|uniref:Lipoprotein YvcA n=1 Tax=Metabacillus malikii TaxID=1504265 RepID=A0ABT9ZHE1_9BACI|nr:hypothetical protein [Metabacillus malikii]MDQ0231217.1 hypothetical protein [Metabacillus malikii]
MKKEAEPKEWPKTPAFQDEDTRKMLDSTKEVQDGYYLYTSKTGGYSMLWPVDATKHSYENQKNNYEMIIFGGSSEKENYVYEIRTSYDAFIPESLLDSYISILSDSLQYSDEYIEIKDKSKTIYFGKKKEHFLSSEDNRRTFYYYFGLVRDINTNQGIRVIYTTRCFDPENARKCSINESKEEERALMLMKSLKFNTVDIKDKKSE